MAVPRSEDESTSVLTAEVSLEHVRLTPGARFIDSEDHRIIKHEDRAREMVRCKFDEDKNKKLEGKLQPSGSASHINFRRLHGVGRAAIRPKNGQTTGHLGRVFRLTGDHFPTIPVH